jgi:hypothetical protein
MCTDFRLARDSDGIPGSMPYNDVGTRQFGTIHRDASRDLLTILGAKLQRIMESSTQALGRRVWD